MIHTLCDGYTFNILATSQKSIQTSCDQLKSLMDHHSVKRVSRFFPSSLTSCQFRSVPDVVQSSVPIKKGTKFLHHEIEHPIPSSDIQKRSSVIKSQEPKTTLKKAKEVSKHYQKRSLLVGSDAEGRRRPAVTSVSVMDSTKQERAKETKMNNSISSSNSGRWFSSDDEAADDQCDGKSDTFLSLSSCTSSESFRLKSAKIHSKRFDSKMSTELGRCSSALTAYLLNAALSPCSQKTTKSGSNTAQKHGKSTRRDSKTDKTWHRWETDDDDFVIDNEILKGCQVSEASAELYYDGSGSHHCRKSTKSRRKTSKKHRRKKGQIKSDKDGQLLNAVVEDGVEDAYAVEKSTSDPYNDFRTSMLEMIIEKQIFGVKDLEKLLECFLSLNSPYYHMVIIEVFTEICDTLFAY